MLEVNDGMCFQEERFELEIISQSLLMDSWIHPHTFFKYQEGSRGIMKSPWITPINRIFSRRVLPRGLWWPQLSQDVSAESTCGSSFQPGALHAELRCIPKLNCNMTVMWIGLSQGHGSSAWPCTATQRVLPLLPWIPVWARHNARKKAASFYSLQWAFPPWPSRILHPLTRCT